MAKEQQYIINAGTERPDSIDIGTLERNMGQGTINGAIEKIVPARGQIAVPNWTQAWAVRLNKKGEPVPNIDVRDKEYEGQIKELPWNSPGGSLIICRYLKGYNSIDQLFQDVVLNAKEYVNGVQETPDSAEVAYLFMLSGMNMYDPESDRYLIQMLRVHYLNRASKFKNPESDKWWFDEYSVEADGVKVEKKLDAKFEALKVVNEASEDNSLMKLKNLLTVVASISDNTPKEIDIYKYLQILADSKPVEFLAQIDEYKKKVSNLFEKAKSFNLIDLSKDGIIAAGDGKKEPIGSEVPGKKDGKIDWVLANYLDSNAWGIVLQLESITSKL